jgi:hypothetical protein
MSDAVGKGCAIPGWMDKFAQDSVIKGQEVMALLDGLYEHAIMVTAPSLFNLTNPTRGSV